MPLLFLFASFSPSYSSTMLQLSTSSTRTWGRPILQAPFLALKSESEAKRGHKGHSHLQSLTTSILPSPCSSPGQELLPPPPTCNTATVLELTAISSSLPQPPAHHVGNICVEEDLVQEDKDWEANNSSTTSLQFSWFSYCCCEDPMPVTLHYEIV